MYKATQRVKTLLLACFTVLFSVFFAVTLWVTPTNHYQANAAEEKQLSLGISGSTGTVSGTSIKWTNNGISFINAKGTSTTAIRTSDTDHFRVYVGNITTLEVPNNVTVIKIVITCTSTSYASILLNNTTIENASASLSGSTVSFTDTDNIINDLKITTAKQWRLNKVEITYTEASASSCEHVNQTTTTEDATCTENGSITVTCDDCGATVSTEETPATGHINTTKTTIDATCTEKGSITVTCDDCGETVSTETIDALGHNFDEPTYESNSDGTHDTTGTCLTCGESTTETEDCNYERTENEISCTYTCSACEYTYSVNKYTVTYNVPTGIPAIEDVKVEANKAINLEAAETVDGYTFIGWTTEEYTSNTQRPETIYEADYQLTVTSDVSLYALYSYAVGDAEESWSLVTDASTLAVSKQIVIAASGSNYALSTTQNGNNRGQASITKADEAVTFGEDVQIITIEAGLNQGTFAFNVGSGYLFAASSGSNYLRTETALTANSSWSITIADGVATIKATGTYTRNWLRYNSSSKIFSCYASGQNDVCIYVKTGGMTTYYATSFEDVCTHENTTTTTVDATCTEKGVTRIVCECGYIVSEEEIEALGHNYVENFCSVCGEQDPETIDYSSYYYISFTHSETVYFADNSQLSSNRYYAKTEAPAPEAIATNYVYRLAKTGSGIYSLYEFDGDCYQENITVEKIDGVYRFYATVDGDACQFLLNAGSETKYIKFYKASNAAQSNYAQDITLTPVELSATINSASITLHDELAINYKITMSDEFAGAKMYFTVNGETVDVDGKEVDERYVFSLNLPPQYMATNIEAQLKLGDVVLAEKAEYSVKTYAQNQLNNSPSDELKQLLTDLLYYGDAAYNYVNNTTGETPVTSGVENLGTASTAEPDSTNFTLVKNEEIDSYPAYFTAAGVRFEGVNKLYVKISTTENVTLTINDVEVEVTGTTIYTDGILAENFADQYKFVLSCNGVVMQTLTYSVNAYAYAMKGEDTMGILALALYRYGKSAADYKA